MTSQKFSLDKTDIKEISKQVIIIYSPVFLLFLDQIESWEFDIKFIFALIISTTIDIARRFIKDYSDNIRENINESSDNWNIKTDS